MEELSIPYFRNLLETNVKELQGFCKKWEDCCSDDIPSEVDAEIRTTIGLTNLLLNQKLKQFSGLIDDSEYKRGEKEINCEDLQGFWDMVYNEVGKIHKCFKKLEDCQSNGWVFVEEQTNKPELKKQKSTVVTSKVASAAKERAVAARQRLAEAKLKMKAQMEARKLEINIDKPLEIISVKESPSEEPKSKNVGNNVKLTKLVDVVEKVQKDSALKKTRKPVTTKKVQSSDDGNKESLKKQKMEKNSSKKGSVSTGSKKALKAADENRPDTTPLRRKRNKTVDVPLQCVTRSAAKKALSEKNAT